MKLSVIVLAYNQAAFIEQALESVLNQRTNFPFEILVAEDCSTDETARIASRFEANHAGLVRVLRRGRNLGMQSNFIDAYGQCRGEYVATLDGDDYWTSVEKLQTQVDLLDRHPEYPFCFHNVSTLSDRLVPNTPNVLGRTDRTRFELDDLIVDNFVPFGSVVARTGLIRAFSPWVLAIRGIDWIFGMLNARFGPIARVEGTMGVYRIHDGGAWSTLDRVRQIETIQSIYRGIRDELPARVGPLVDTLIRNCELELYARELQEVVRTERDNAATLREKYSSLDEYAKRMKAQYEDTNDYAKVLQAQYVALESSRDELTRKYESLETFLREERDVKELARRYQTLEEYASDLQRKYGEMETYSNSLRSQYEALESASREQCDRLSEVEAYSHELQVLLARREAELDRARERFDSDQVRFDRDRMAFVEKYQKLETYTSGLSRKYESVESYTKVLQQKYESLESATRDLQNRYATVEAYARELQTYLTLRKGDGETVPEKRSSNGAFGEAPAGESVRLQA